MTYYSNHHYNPRLKLLARKLRKTSKSNAEKALWKFHLSRRQSGVRFLRQRSIDRYIVDFFAPEIGLIIEIDGSSHAAKGEYDRIREKALQAFGYRLIRFTESEVLNDKEGVLRRLNHTIFCLKQERK